jgi:hypothetical protein
VAQHLKAGWGYWGCERADLLGAEFNIRSSVGVRTTVAVTLADRRGQVRKD